MGRSKTTRSTRSGRAFTTERAPASPVSRWSSGKTSRAKTTGVPCVPLKTGTTIGFPPRANAASSAGTTGSGVFGWAPSAISAARVHGLSAATPTAIELPCPSWGRGFTAKRAASPASASRTAESSWPVTTTTSSTRGRRPSTTQRTTGLPSSWRSSFWRPIRRANPAARTIPPIMREAVKRAGGVGAPGGRSTGRGARPRPPPPHAGVTRPVGAHGPGAGARDADARLGAHTLLVERQRGAGADHGEARRGMRELHVRGARAGGEQRHADLDEDLPLLERRRHEPEEPLVHADLALALRPLADHLGAERDHRRRPVGGRVGVSQ